MQVIDKLTEWASIVLAGVKIHPSLYRPIILPPWITDEFVVSSGVFPKFEKLLAPAVAWMVVLGVVRMALHYIVFKPLAQVAMGIKAIPLKPNAAIDRVFSPKVKKIDVRCTVPTL
jgi:hypothetical protein